MTRDRLLKPGEKEVSLAELLRRMRTVVAANRVDEEEARRDPLHDLAEDVLI